MTSILFFFFLNNLNLFIYLFLAVLGLRFCARAISSCGKRGPLLIAVRWPPTVTASLVAEHRLQTRRLSNLWLTGPVTPWHAGSSQTRARTHVPCSSRQILNHCATREALYSSLFASFLYECYIIQKFLEFGHLFHGVSDFGVFNYLVYLCIFKLKNNLTLLICLLI